MTRIKQAKNRKLPPQIPGTTRAWRRRKRGELAALRRVAKAFNNGSAYVPCYAEWKAVERLLTTMHEQLSPAVWGR